MLEFVYRMANAVPYEGLSKSAREEERSKRRTWLSKLPTNSTESSFLTEMAGCWAETQERTEDMLEGLRLAAATKAADSQEAMDLARARKGVLVAANCLKRTALAAQEGMAMAAEIFNPHLLESTLSEEEIKVYKACKKRQEEEAKKAKSHPGGAGAMRNASRYAPYYQPAWGWYQQQQQAGQGPWGNAAMGQAPQQQAGQYSSQQGAAGQQYPALTFQGAGDPAMAGQADPARGAADKSRWPCRTCGKYGHWFRDGLCKPEDVAAEMQRKYGYAAPAPAPPGKNSIILLMRSIYV